MRNTVLYELVSENLSALSPLILSIISIIVIMYSLPKISKYLADATKDNTWIERYRTIQIPFDLIHFVRRIIRANYDLDFTHLQKSMQIQKDSLSQIDLYKKKKSLAIFFYCSVSSPRSVLCEKINTKNFSKLFLLFCSFICLLLFGGMSPFFGNRIRAIQQSQYHSVLAIPVASIMVMLGHYGMKWIVFPSQKDQNRV